MCVLYALNESFEFMKFMVLKIIDFPLCLHQSGCWDFFSFYSITSRVIIKFQITCNSVLHTPNKSFFFDGWILPTKLKAISPVALRGNQADSAIIGVIVLNDSPDFFSKQFFWLWPKCFINAFSMTNLAWYAEENLLLLLGGNIQWRYKSCLPWVLTCTASLENLSKAAKHPGVLQI